MSILSYIHIIVNIRALLPFIMYKASSSFDFLMNASCLIQLKGLLPDTRRIPSPPKMVLVNIKLLFVKLIKLVIISMRIYKEYYTQSHA
ncbi:MAG: hypothetical protein DRH33_08795 [Candidatus Nealsonbacteria bacterium]|nr:MAG: hypothetical protein DRH33_08795 [Candidatus Nealsonbacteria bacterium]